MGVKYLDETMAPAPGSGSADSAGASSEIMRTLWTDRRWSLTAVISLALVLGLGSAWLTPRGPIGSGEALWTMGAGAFVGIAAGLLMGNRWPMLIVPIAFIAVFETARLDMIGPTVDSIHLDSIYGIIAFVLGRVMHGVFLFAPVALGTIVGVALAGAMGNTTARSPGTLGWTITVVFSAALAVLAFAIARPASTAPILGTESPARSIAELTTLPIGGHQQAMMIRGRDIENPVLLYLTGGPGGTDIGAMRGDVGLEEHFVAATWEQRGAGKSYGALDPTDTFTLSQMVSDTLEVTEYLRERFDEDKIFLVGQSWGSTLGALAVAQRPDLFHAFIGVGQMVSQRETDIMFWEDALAWSESTGRNEVADTLRRNGPPPYDDVNDYAPVVSYEHDWNAYPEFDATNEMPAILFVPEYTLMDRINAFRGFLDTNATLYPQLQGIDFREDLPNLEVPYYMVLGEHEARGRDVLAREWFEQLEAPFKELIEFGGAGHRAHFDRPGLFAEVMARVLDGSGAEAGSAEE